MLQREIVYTGRVFVFFILKGIIIFAIKIIHNKNRIL